MKKAAYGLGDVAKERHDTLVHKLRKIGLENLKNEPAVFFRKIHEELIGILFVHVDDFLYGGNAEFLMCIEKLEREIVIGTHLKPNFKFCGMEIKIKPNGELQTKVADQKEK